MKALPKKLLRLVLVGIAATSLFCVLLARASMIPVGRVTFTGDFTFNHLYDFNNPGAQPFGWFQIETVSNCMASSADTFMQGTSWKEQVHLTRFITCHCSVWSDYNSLPHMQ